MSTSVPLQRWSTGGLSALTPGRARTFSNEAVTTPRAKGFVKEWEESSILEHQALIDLVRSGRSQAAANHIRDIHWSFKVQEPFVRKYYPGIAEPAG